VRVYAGGDLKLASGTIQAALWTSPEAKAGMRRLHFGQVHRIAVIGTILMGRGRALLDLGRVARAQEIPFETVVMDKTKRLRAGEHQPILICGNIGKGHFGMVFVAEWVNFAYRRESGHGLLLSIREKKQ
jgi:hypothetical protein